jgi:hypothetical protein
MQQDPREFFGFDDPRAIQEVLADDEPSAGELLAAVDPVTAHDMDALLTKVQRQRDDDDESEQRAFYEQSDSFREHLAVTGRQW